MAFYFPEEDFSKSLSSFELWLEWRVKTVLENKLDLTLELQYIEMCTTIIAKDRIHLLIRNVPSCHFIVLFSIYHVFQFH